MGVHCTKWKIGVLVYICSRCEQLGLESRDLSQAEKQIFDVKPEQIIKMAIIFTQNGQKMSMKKNVLQQK